MAKHNERYTREDYNKFFVKVTGQIMAVVNSAILYGIETNKVNNTKDLQNDLDDLYTMILHEADYIFLKEDDKND